MSHSRSNQNEADTYLPNNWTKHEADTHNDTEVIEGRMAETLATFDTGETADCVEACGVPGLEASMVVATYQLHKATSNDDSSAAQSPTAPTGDRRSGTLQHFHLSSGLEQGESVQIDKTQHLETSSGVFDIKWSAQAHGGRALLGTATAAGTLELFELKKNDDGAHDAPATLQHTGVKTDGDAESMCLSLDWSDRVHAAAEPSICVSHSDGYACKHAEGILACSNRLLGS